jgi:hypothetical protein
MRLNPHQGRLSRADPAEHSVSNSQLDFYGVNITQCRCAKGRRSASCTPPKWSPRISDFRHPHHQTGSYHGIYRTRNQAVSSPGTQYRSGYSELCDRHVWDRDDSCRTLDGPHLVLVGERQIAINAREAPWSPVAPVCFGKLRSQPTQGLVWALFPEEFGTAFPLKTNQEGGSWISTGSTTTPRLVEEWPPITTPSSP